MKRPGGSSRLCKTPEQLALMRRAGAVVAEMHAVLRAAAVAGTTTAELDALARDVLARRGATSNFLGYHGYPAVICASVNEVVVHGIPNHVPLADGDLLSVDCGAVVEGWHGDAAFSMVVGGDATNPAAARLAAAVDDALAAAIEAMRPGATLGDIGAAVQEVAERHGVGIVDGYGGHGIGRAMHERPDVANRGRRGKGMKLEPGMVLAVEPMFTASGTEDVEELDDGWTVVTVDRSLAAHSEHSIAVTSSGRQILTLP